MNNFEETAVKTVTVDRDKLKEKLRENLARHTQDYVEAMEGFRDARRQAVSKLHAAAGAFDGSEESVLSVQRAFGEFNGLAEPQDHSKDYDQAIALMDWEQREQIELSINDFECYVRDSWSWKRRFAESVINYKASAARR